MFENQKTAEEHLLHLQYEIFKVAPDEVILSIFSEMKIEVLKKFQFVSVQIQKDFERTVEESLDLSVKLFKKNLGETKKRFFPMYADYIINENIKKLQDKYPNSIKLKN